MPVNYTVKAQSAGACDAPLPAIWLLNTFRRRAGALPSAPTAIRLLTHFVDARAVCRAQAVTPAAGPRPYSHPAVNAFRRRAGGLQGAGGHAGSGTPPLQPCGG